MKRTVEELNISYLLHFTQADNLKSIFEYGILPVIELRKRGITAKINDLSRFDFCLGATSVSIQFPNYKLFYKFRKEDKTINWVVLGLDPCILWEKQCAFCVDNAANSNISTISIQDRMGQDALKKMYDEIPGKPLRKILGISSSCPTNPQAEVLVFDIIEPEKIRGVIFKDRISLTLYKDIIRKELQIVNDAFFNARKDYMYWK